MRTGEKWIAGVAASALLVAALGGAAGEGGSRAEELLAAGKAAEAREAAREETGRTPENVVAWRWLALSCEALERWEEAEQAWRVYAQITRSTANRAVAAEHVAWCRARFDGGVKPAPAEIDPAALATVEPRFSIETSAHFTVKTRNGKLTQLVSARAEAYLTSLCRTFLGDRVWAHEIPISVHADHAEYVAAGNPEWSGGGTAFRFEAQGALDWRVKRSIDLFQLADGKLDPELLPNTLPHELTHLVLSEHFGEHPAPLWLTEGLAQLMESVAPEYYDRVVVGDLNGGRKFYVPLPALLDLPGYPDHPGPKYLFYRESASFTQFLLQSMPRERFFAFLEEVKRGFSPAAGLGQVFAVPPEQVAERLERKWLDGLIARYGRTVGSVEEAEKGR